LKPTLTTATSGASETLQSGRTGRAAEMPRPKVNLAYLTFAGVNDGQPAPEALPLTDVTCLLLGTHPRRTASAEPCRAATLPSSLKRRPAFTAQMLPTARQAPQRRRPCPSPRRQRTEPLFDEWGGRVPACSPFRPMAHGEFRNIQRPMLKDVLQELCRAGGAQASGECWSVVPGLVCVEDGPPPKNKFRSLWHFF